MSGFDTKGDRIMIATSADFSRTFAAEAGTDKRDEAAGTQQRGRLISLTERNRSNMSNHMRTLAGHLQTVREEERMRIAREIHDELGQVLTALKMDLSWIKKQLPADRLDLIQKAQSDLDLIGTAVQSVKRICTDLRPDILDTLGLGAAIEWKANDFQKRSGIPCSVLVDPEDLKLDRNQTTALFRIFQEALTNVVKHAHATKVHATLLKEGDQVTLEVSDNGVGIQPEQRNKPNSFGLLGMHERVQPWNGKVTISATGGGGTLVQVVLTLPQAQDGAAVRKNGRKPEARYLEHLLCSLMG